MYPNRYQLIYWDSSRAPHLPEPEAHLVPSCLFQSNWKPLVLTGSHCGENTCKLFFGVIQSIAFSKALRLDSFSPSLILQFTFPPGSLCHWQLLWHRLEGSERQGAIGVDRRSVPRISLSSASEWAVLSWLSNGGILALSNHPFCNFFWLSHMVQDTAVIYSLARCQPWQQPCDLNFYVSLSPWLKSHILNGRNSFCKSPLSI